MNKIPITVIIPVKNEEKNLESCLKQLFDFEQVIVVDSQSTDNTPSIVQLFGFEYVNFIWNGKFPKKRNWALANLNIICDWVLFLDADELLTVGLIEEIKLKITDKKYNGYWIYYDNYFMGKRLKFGDTMKKLPLFRISAGRYEKINENSWSRLDMEVHEHPIIKGKTSVLKNRVLHNDYRGLEHYISKHNEYSTWEAYRYLQLKSQGLSNLNFRQRIKYSLINTGFLPIIYFIGAYFLKLGILDGRAGLFIVIFKAHYFFQIRTKIIELSKSVV